MKRIVFSILAISILTGCFKKYGCTSPNAFNFDIGANEDSGLCEFASDAFGGVYDGSQTIFHISNDSVVSQNILQDSFVIFIADTHRVQLKGFYECANAQDTLGCLARGYNLYLNGTNSCAANWKNFYFTREGDSVVVYHYQKAYNSTDRDSVIGRARKR